MFSTRPTTPTALTLAWRAANSRIKPMTKAAPARPRHVPFHLAHACGGLDRDAAGIKGHSLADKGERCGLPIAGAAPLHDNEPRRAGAALGDAEQRAHPQFAHCRLVEHLDLNAKLFERASLGRQGLGIDHIARLRHEIAGKT